MAEETGLRLGDDAVSETQLRDVLLALHPGGGHIHARDLGGDGQETEAAATRACPRCGAAMIVRANPLGNPPRDRHMAVR